MEERKYVCYSWLLKTWFIFDPKGRAGAQICRKGVMQELNCCTCLPALINSPICCLLGRLGNFLPDMRRVPLIMLALYKMVFYHHNIIRLQTNDISMRVFVWYRLLICLCEVYVAVHGCCT